jgi:hypothetical protein
VGMRVFFLLSDLLQLKRANPFHHKHGATSRTPVRSLRNFPFCLSDEFSDHTSHLVRHLERGELAHPC